MWDHKSTDIVSIDETTPGSTDYAAVAYCECGWQADHWHHADAYGDSESRAHDAALDDAEAHALEYAA